MKLSIIIPVYNVEKYLRAAIDSVLAQTFRDFELILVVDGATDRSGEICDRYATEDTRVRVIHQKNAGVSQARNAGVAAAQGKYIGFTDSDDIIERDMFEIMVTLAEEQSADVVQCQHDREDRLNRAVRSGEVIQLDGQAFVRRMMKKSGGDYTNQVALWSKIYKRELFEGIIFPAGRTYEDEQETYKLCLKGKKILEIPDVLYHYIKRDNSIITGVSEKKMLDKQQALLDRLYYLPQRLPDLGQACASAYWEYCKATLCELYRRGGQDAIQECVGYILPHKKQLKFPMDFRDRLYLWLLPWKCTRNWVLRNEFEPIQAMQRKFYGLFRKSDSAQDAGNKE